MYPLLIADRKCPVLIKMTFKAWILGDAREMVLRVNVDISLVTVSHERIRLPLKATRKLENAN